MKNKPKKKLVRGKDWHAWAYKSESEGLYHWAVARKPIAQMDDDTRNEPGKWVRVKFVEVK